MPAADWKADAGSLPSSRTLSQELNVSRNTVLSAYDQLAAEGYLTTRRGSATTVASWSSETSLPGVSAVRKELRAMSHYQLQ